MIWEEHIAVNANLSGMELLHVHEWYQQGDLIQVLGCLPVLKDLILREGLGLDADFFREFVPMGPDGTPIIKQSSDEGQKSVILCPMLRNFLVEDFDSTVPLELIPVFKDVVTLRGAGGSPLKRFSLFDFAFKTKFKLIGRHESFMVKEVARGKHARSFRLDI